MHEYHGFTIRMLLKCPRQFEFELHQSLSSFELTLKHAAGSNFFLFNSFRSRIRQLLGKVW